MLRRCARAIRWDVRRLLLTSMHTTLVPMKINNLGRGTYRSMHIETICLADAASSNVCSKRSRPRSQYINAIRLAAEILLCLDIAALGPCNPLFPCAASYLMADGPISRLSCGRYAKTRGYARHAVRMLDSIDARMGCTDSVVTVTMVV